GGEEEDEPGCSGRSNAYSSPSSPYHSVPIPSYQGTSVVVNAEPSGTDDRAGASLADDSPAFQASATTSNPYRRPSSRN
ncbi:hypothetical protein PMAYCL1PPCAC_10236, partial [Pristionchus mayeri]